MRVNAVFEGGGVKALGLVGAVKAAEQNHVSFEGLAGTSSGSIVAALLAAGYNADEMYAFIQETPFEQFLHKDWFHHLHVVGTTIRIFVKKGLYSGDLLKAWVNKKLMDRGICCFGDLPTNKLKIIASDISRGRLLVLPDDIAQYGMNPAKLEIAEAIRMSTSIPYFFEPVVIPKINKFKHPIYIVDGALLSNFPLWIFDKAYASSKNKKIIPTLGFQLVGRNMYIPNKIYGPLSMFKALFSTMMEAHDDRYIEKVNRFRTIKIPTLGVQTTQFDLSVEMKEKLFYAGKLAGQEFFDQWSFSEYTMNLNKHLAQ